MDYAWVITRDHLADMFGDPAEQREEGVSGPSAAPDDLLARVKAGEGHEFKMYDDDGELYYTGRLLTAGDMGAEEHCAGPLDDFGTPNAGCTRIRWTGHPEWEVG